MKKNQLGSSDLYVSEIALGCMSFGNDERQDIKMMHNAIDEGINYIDTADLYGFGANEELVGKALQGERDQVVLGTKVGNRWDRVNEGWEWAPDKPYIQKAVKDSLKRLKTDYIDLYQLHGGTIDDPIDEIIEAFEELKQQGYIREYGISSIRPNVIKTYLEKSNIVSIMMQYSLLDRRPEEYLDVIGEHNVSVIARGPIAKGLLSERSLPGVEKDSYLDYDKKEIEKLIENIQKELVDDERGISQIALRYPLAHPTVATVIPGASHMDQLIKNIKAKNISLNEEELLLLKQWSKESYYQKHR